MMFMKLGIRYSVLATEKLFLNIYFLVPIPQSLVPQSSVSSSKSTFASGQKLGILPNVLLSIWNQLRNIRFIWVKE
ncbi:hypothetical protein A6S26_22485 [Nostoc sp. ATCC 43529]|nr:hypothetical protein A6S26_22485 [Nostoc sp. ATCC 43529]